MCSSIYGGASRLLFSSSCTDYNDGPLPTISKEFSLVVPEEHQRSIHQNLSQLPVFGHSNVTAVKSSSFTKAGKFDKQRK